MTALSSGQFEQTFARKRTLTLFLYILRKLLIYKYKLWEAQRGQEDVRRKNIAPGRVAHVEDHDARHTRGRAFRGLPVRLAVAV
jgi:hypothetical protein